MPPETPQQPPQPPTPPVVPVAPATPPAPQMPAPGQPTPPPAPPQQPGVQPYPLGPVTGGKISHTLSEKRRQIFMGLGVIVVIGLLVGGYLYYKEATKPAPPPPTPTPVSTSDLVGPMNDLSESLDEADANISGLDAALADQQGDLSE